MTDLLDTNVILRYLVGDIKIQQEQARQWFAQAQEGKRKIVIKPIVVAEAAFVLESYYKKRRDEITDSFSVLLSQRWLMVEERDALLNMLPVYQSGKHFVDSFLTTSAKLTKAHVLTFDKKLRVSSEMD